MMIMADDDDYDAKCMRVVPRLDKWPCSAVQGSGQLAHAVIARTMSQWREVRHSFCCRLVPLC